MNNTENKEFNLEHFNQVISDFDDKVNILKQISETLEESSNVKLINENKELVSENKELRLTIKKLEKKIKTVQTSKNKIVW